TSSVFLLITSIVACGSDRNPGCSTLLDPASNQSQSLTMWSRLGAGPVRRDAQAAIVGEHVDRSVVDGRERLRGAHLVHGARAVDASAIHEHEVIGVGRRR